MQELALVATRLLQPSTGIADQIGDATVLSQGGLDLADGMPLFHPRRPADDEAQQQGRRKPEPQQGPQRITVEAIGHGQPRDARRSVMPVQEVRERALVWKVVFSKKRASCRTVVGKRESD